MSKWRARLYGYTGLAIVIGLWTPLVWFISAARDRYRMYTFDMSRMEAVDMVLLVVICAATLLAQIGFILVAHDLTKYEQREREQKGDRYADF